MNEFEIPQAHDVYPSPKSLSSWYSSTIVGRSPQPRIRRGYRKERASDFSGGEWLRGRKGREKGDLSRIE